MEYLRMAAEESLKSFELRGRGEGFPATLVTIDASDVEPTLISRDPVGSPQDYSLTNSRRAVDSVYISLISGHFLVSERLGQLIWDPPDADYIDDESEVCTPDDQRIAYSLKAYMAGDSGGALQFLNAIGGRDKGLSLHGTTIRALVEGSRVNFLRHLRDYIRWHEKEAKKRSNQKNADLFLCMPALGLSVLAIRGGLVRLTDLPTDSAHVPVEMIRAAVT